MQIGAVFNDLFFNADEVKIVFVGRTLLFGTEKFKLTCARRCMHLNVFGVHRLEQGIVGQLQSIFKRNDRTERLTPWKLPRLSSLSYYAQFEQRKRGSPKNKSKQRRMIENCFEVRRNNFWRKRTIKTWEHRVFPARDRSEREQTRESGRNYRLVSVAVPPLLKALTSDRLRKAF